MGIAPYKSFVFDGESSIDYGVYLTGEGVFNAPERAVEMITIPNRNGAYALDQGRFENIEITYHAGMVDVNESNFAQKVEAFRNWICSKVGYCRLEDDYNPNEYRMAIYKAGIEVDHTFLIAGEFDITFECKPQRWLKSGENLELVTSGGTVNNPTNFKASPLLAVKGYGNLQFNGYSMDIENAPFGDIQISAETANSVTIDTANCNIGDLMYGLAGSVGQILGKYSYNVAAVPNYVNSGSVNGTGTVFGSTDYYIGTAWSKTISAGTLWGQAYRVDDPDTTYSWTATVQFTVAYDGNNTVTITPTVTKSGAGASYINITTAQSVAELWATSSKSVLGDPTYIDCDIGEAYSINGGTITVLNSVVMLGSDLPKLATGANTITYDNTITELKIASRCWQL